MGLLSTELEPLLKKGQPGASMLLLLKLSWLVFVEGSKFEMDGVRLSLFVDVGLDVK